MINLSHLSLNRYLAKDYVGAYIFYTQAVELGYEPAQNNAAYLLDHAYVNPWDIIGVAVEKQQQPPRESCAASWLEGHLGGKRFGGPDPMTQELQHRLSLRAHWLAVEVGQSRESYLPLGDAFYYGLGGK